jgi:hypothetical protein
LLRAWIFSCRPESCSDIGDTADRAQAAISDQSFCTTEELEQLLQKHIGSGVRGLELQGQASWQVPTAAVPPEAADGPIWLLGGKTFSVQVVEADADSCGDRVGVQVVCKGHAQEPASRKSLALAVGESQLVAEENQGSVTLMVLRLEMHVEPYATEYRLDGATVYAVNGSWTRKHLEGGSIDFGRGRAVFKNGGEEMKLTGLKIVYKEAEGALVGHGATLTSSGGRLLARSEELSVPLANPQQYSSRS